MTANILIVDDLETNLKLLEAKLLSEYYTVYTASSGQGAIDILKEQKIDVVLLDGMMPGMDGFETCKLIKANPETTHIPVVMVTALSDIQDRVRGLEAGADEFLTKPVNDTALFARVKSLSRTKAVIDELKLRNQTSAELGGSIIECVDNFHTAKILIIDDDIVQAKNISNILSPIVAEVKITNKLEGIDTTVLGLMPEMVIISCQLAIFDPLRVVAIIRGVKGMGASPIMLLAEEESIPMVIRGLELGVNDYFLYPVDHNELLARVKTQLRRKKYQDALRVQIEESVNLSIKDELTSLFNLRYFKTHLQQLISNPANAQTFCLVMLDIDHFKAVNDTYGHQAGNIVLKKTTGALRAQLRVTDLIARYGGEEFVVILTDIDATNALKVMDRIRDGIAHIDFEIPGLPEPIHKTISMGIAEFNKTETAEQLIERADKALYKAKGGGRNQVIVG